MFLLILASHLIISVLQPRGIKAKLTRLCFRVLAVSFGIVVVISISVAVTLILTQKRSFHFSANFFLIE